MSLDTPTLDPEALDRVRADTNTGRHKWGGGGTPWQDVRGNEELMGELETMSAKLGVPLFEED